MDGFLSAAAGAAAGYLPGLGNVIEAAADADPTGAIASSMITGAIGGTAAAIGGGNFANGVFTASFQHLLNDKVNSFWAFVSGMADVMSFGISRGIRNNVDYYEESVNYESDSYRAGEYTGIAVDVAMGGKALFTKGAATGAVKGVSGARASASTDKHVGAAATALDQAFPGAVSAVNSKMAANVAGGIREVDIVMDQFIIQVKSGRADGLVSQMRDTTQTLINNSRTVIGYASDNMSIHAWREAANSGISIARNMDELLQIVRELRRY